MASPLKPGKQSVDLAAPAVRVSRIRRDPPPKVKEVTAAEIKERDQHAMAVGVIAFALSLFVILFAFGNASLRSPQEYRIEIRAEE